MLNWIFTPVLIYYIEIESVTANILCTYNLYYHKNYDITFKCKYLVISCSVKKITDNNVIYLRKFYEY